MDTELTAHERAGRVTLELVLNGKITNARVRSLTGLKKAGSYKLLNSLSRRVIPLIYDRKDGTWYIFRGLLEVDIPVIR